MANFKNIQDQLNKLEKKDWNRRNLEVQDDEEKLKNLLQNPVGAIKQMAEPVPMPIAKPMIKFSPDEQAKNSAAWQQMTANKDMPADPRLAEKMTQDADMNDLIAGSQAAPKPEPTDLLKDPRVFEMIKRQLGAK